MSRKTEAEVGVDGDPINPKTDYSLNLEKSSNVITTAKKVTSKEIANNGRAKKRRIRGTKCHTKMKIPQP